MLAAWRASGVGCWRYLEANRDGHCGDYPEVAHQRLNGKRVPEVQLSPGLAPKERTHRGQRCPLWHTLHHKVLCQWDACRQEVASYWLWRMRRFLGVGRATVTEPLH